MLHLKAILIAGLFAAAAIPANAQGFVAGFGQGYLRTQETLSQIELQRALTEQLRRRASPYSSYASPPPLSCIFIPLGNGMYAQECH